MFKLLALISVLTSAVLAEQPTATNATSDPSTNTLIPSGVSDSCNIFLTTLNSDPNLAGCLSMMTNVTSAFAPGNEAPSSSAVSTALTNLCDDSVTAACPQSLIRQNIANFYAACPNELATNSPPGVRTIYEVVYLFFPLRQSVCSKDDSGNWCVAGQSSSAREFDEDSDKSPLGMSDILALFSSKTDNGALTRRDQTAITPNLGAISDEGIPLLFFTPKLSSNQLCVTCLRQVLTAYINFESNAPPAYPINDTTLLSAQSALYNAVQSKCPASFLGGTVGAANGLSGGLSSSAIPTYGGEYQRITALVMGAVILVVSVAL